MNFLSQIEITIPFSYYQIARDYMDNGQFDWAPSPAATAVTKVKKNYGNRKRRRKIGYPSTGFDLDFLHWKKLRVKKVKTIFP